MIENYSKIDVFGTFTLAPTKTHLHNHRIYWNDSHALFSLDTADHKEGEAATKTRFYKLQDLPYKKLDCITVCEKDDWRIVTGQSKQSVGQQSGKDIIRCHFIHSFIIIIMSITAL